MKKTKAGLCIIEDSDQIPDGDKFTDQLFEMINILRKEHNKTAKLIDELQEQIDELGKKFE